jgi:hypothetical protein
MKFLPFLFLILSLNLRAQSSQEDPFQGLNFRSIGPAFTSGRIADIAIHPQNENLWYVAVGSGGVWKTKNAGTTWTPIFDHQSSYSIGCITLDPSNPNTIWVGTGENVGGRHVGFGDGIYVSHDGGNTWVDKGLKNSEHLSKIIVHPSDPNTIWVASQGPLWSKGGERGVYKSVDGGNTWKKTLGDSLWTGATDLLIDPNNPNILYAATWQRHRTVAAYLGGGPGSGIHKSIDGGNTWTKLNNGIPSVNLGKIGLAMSPFNSQTIYAAIELENLTGGIFVSYNGGNSWSKNSDVVSGGTGPHYYQELYASPHKEGRLYLMNNYVKISEDHGRTFSNMNENKKHVDSHAMAFKKSDPNYLLFGTDGGLYESFDHTETWKFIRNLPVTQYYKIAVDDSQPFYKIYGGTQDNGSHGGPSRTFNQGGIFNHDWWVTLFADGHQSATEPGNPNITYGEFQEGWLWRIDQTTKETVFIQPQPSENDPPERFNWDSPILVSPHKPARLYFASQRVWRSEDRGDSWTPISGDLTLNEDRMKLPIMGGFHSPENAWDMKAMSTYNTITSLAESPAQEGLIYAGTDDGLIQISENGGQNWQKLVLSTIKGLPSTPFVNDVRADLFDANTVYAALDNHKNGDYKPYLIKSTDKGKTWKLITNGLPNRLLTWRLVQDHVNPNIIFAATEFGVYVSYDKGGEWQLLKGNLPTIAVRDITIHRKTDDLVLGTFGRGIYILDDLSPIRAINTKKMPEQPLLMEVKPAWWYVPAQELYGQGNAEYAAENPPFGAIFTYFLPNPIKSSKDTRKENEKNASSITFPGWDALDAEKNQSPPSIILTVKNNNGQVVKTVKGTNQKGFNRVNWSLDVADRFGESLQSRNGQESQILTTPGQYSVVLSIWVDGKMTFQSEEKSFSVVPTAEGALPRKDLQESLDFREDYEKFMQSLSSTQDVLSKTLQLTNAMERALDKAPQFSSDLKTGLHDLKQKLNDISIELNGSPSKAEIGEKDLPNPNSGAFIGSVALSSSTYGPTANHQAALKTAAKQLTKVQDVLKSIAEKEVPEFEKQLKDLGAPWIEGQGIR